MFSKFKIITLILALIFLFQPIQAHAFIGTGIFDYFDSALGGVEEMAGPLAGKIIAFLFMYAIGFLALEISGALLTGAMNPSWLQIGNDAMVQTGWGFVVGIANMLIVVILIIIAFGFIFKLENLQMKKTLPKLLMVALLMNFSLLFVQALIDFSNIFYNTFFLGNENLPEVIMSKMLDGIGQSIGALVTLASGLAISFVIPFAAPFVQLAMVTTLGVVFFPQMSIMIFQIIISYVVSGIFLTYAVLFAARSFIVKILAVISPLAFLSLVLPQTKKYWDQWTHALIEWVMLGIPVIFLLVLGLKSADVFLPSEFGTQYSQDQFFGFEMEPYMAYYLFLAMYLAIVVFITKKSMPQGAQAIIDQASGFAKMAWGRGIVPVAGKTKDYLNKFAVKQGQREEELAARAAAGNPVKLNAFQRMGLGFGKTLKTGVNWGHRVTGTSAEAQVEEQIDKKAANFKKRYGKDWKTASGILRKGAFGPGLSDSTDIAAFTRYMESAGGGKALKGLGKEKLAKSLSAVAAISPGDMYSFIRHSPDLVTEEGAMKTFGTEGGQKMASVIQKALVSDGLARNEYEDKYEDKDIQKLAEEGIEKSKLIPQAALKKVIDKMKPTDLESLDNSLGDNKDFQTSIAKWKNNSTFLQRAMEKFGSNFTEAIQKQVESVGAENILKNNPAVIRMTQTNFGKAFMRDFELKDKGGKTINVNSKESIQKAIQDYGGKEAPKVEGLRPMYPNPSKEERVVYGSIAEGKRQPSSAVNEKALRELSGAFNALTYRMDNIDKGIDSLKTDLSKTTDNLERTNLESQIKTKEDLKSQYDIRRDGIRSKIVGDNGVEKKLMDKKHTK